MRWWRLLEVLDEPTPRRSRRTVGPINGPHLYYASSERHFFGSDLNEPAARKIRLDHMPWHTAKPEAGTQERKLGPKVGKAPDSWDLETRFNAPGTIGRIDVREPDVFGED